ncbi:MAG: Abi family protein [Myxococcota bacterium]
MKFTKPALTIDDQVDLLFARGMTGHRERMLRRLRHVNYYRLSAYWHTFRAPGSESFLDGTDFEEVWGRYVFDRQLRLLVMNALERVEVSLRARLACEHATRFGPFGYACDPKTIFEHDSFKRAEFFQRLDKDLTQSGREPFLQHFKEKYGDQHDRPPVWVAAEVLSFGGLVSMFRGSPNAVQKEVAKDFGAPAVVFESWLLVLNAVRNVCAHHGRLWNRTLGLQPKFPRIDVNKDWHTPVSVGKDKAFGTLTILAHCLGVTSPGTQWAHRLASLLDSHPNIPKRYLGIPENWRECPIWARLLANE